MEPKCFTPFVSATNQLLEAIAKEPPVRETAFVKVINTTSHQINVMIGIVGDLTGYVVISMSSRTACSLVAKATDSKVVIFDQDASNHLAEMASVACKVAVANLVKEGYKVGTADPLVLTGTNVSYTSCATASLVVPFLLGQFGNVNLTVNLKKTVKNAA